MEFPRDRSYADLIEGMTEEHDYVITPTVFQSFLTAFDDRSPVHVDEEYAKASGFDGAVMHGGILNGFLSHFVGMVLPGTRSLLLTTDLRFLQPSYLGDLIRLKATISQRLDTHQTVVLQMAFFNQTRDYLAANGRVQVKVRSE